MKPDITEPKKIKVRNPDRIQEVQKTGKGRWAGPGKILVFGGVCFFLGLWIGRNTTKSIRFESIRQADAMPVLFAARGTARTTHPMFSIVAMPKQARLAPASARPNARRPMVKVPMPRKKVVVKKQKPVSKKPVTTAPASPKQKPVKVKRLRQGFYSLQVRAFKDRTQAMAFFKALKARGYGVWAEAYKDPSNISWTRIFVGRFKTMALAKRFQSRFKKMQGITGLVVLKQKIRKKISVRKDSSETKRGKNAKPSH